MGAGVPGHGRGVGGEGVGVGVDTRTHCVSSTTFSTVSYGRRGSRTSRAGTLWGTGGRVPRSYPTERGARVPTSRTSCPFRTSSPVGGRARSPSPTTPGRGEQTLGPSPVIDVYSEKRPLVRPRVGS